MNHPTYGRGTVQQVLTEHGSVKVVVRFREFGIRKVHAKHLG